MAKWTEPRDALDVSRVQQSIEHVEHEQRLHAVVGKAFPSFGERQIAKTARMPDEAAILSVVHGRRECCVRPGLASAGSQDRQLESEMFRKKGLARFRDAARQASNVECSGLRKMRRRFFDKMRQTGT